MRSTLPRRLLSLALLCLLPLCSACSPATSGSSASPAASSAPVESNSEKGKYRVDVAINEETVRYLGRTLDLNNRKFYDWTCSGFEFTFNGTAVEAKLEGPALYVNQEEKRPHIAVYVDDDATPRTHIVLDETSGIYTLAEGLTEGTHTVRVMKVSANRYSGPFYTSQMTIYGNNTPTIGTPPTAPAKQIEFIGDSITCGFGALAPAADSPYTSAEEDGSQGYAYRTAMAFGADANIMSISGFGAYADLAGATKNALPRYYLYDDLELLNQANQTPAHEWDFAAHPSDAVVIHLGTNDAGPVFNPEIKIDGVDVPMDQRMQDFKDAYTAFLHTIREKNPDAYIFCIIGGMGCGLDTTIKEVVAQYQQDTGDSKISFYKFQMTLNSVTDGVRAGHPSVKSHNRMAKELITHIQLVTGWETV